MRVLVTTESRFDRTPDGACWNVGSATYEFWTRYLDVFDEVAVLARVRDVQEPPRNGVRADGPRVSLAPLAYYVGPWAYAHRYNSLRRDIRRAIQPGDSVIVRAPGITTSLVVAALREHCRPFGIEVVGDPHTVFAPGAVRSILRPILRHWVSRELKRQCGRACAAAYVTAGSLQQGYPAARATHVTSYSSIVLPEDAFAREPREARTTSAARIVFVGSLEQMYKGPDVLIDAVAAAASQGIDPQLAIVGDGKHRREIEQLALLRGLEGRVRFLGHLPPGDAVRRELDAADLFVLPSRTEGLPRALIEAMARGLPCIGSDVGGIPELLAPAERVPPGDAGALAAKILELLGDPQRLARLSSDNLRRARDYHSSALRPRRNAFYSAVREATIGWQRNGGRQPPDGPSR